MELKRGFFFSLISLLLLIGLFFLAQPRMFESTIVIEQTNQDRILFTNAIIQNFEYGYLTRAVESQTAVVLEAIAGYRNSTGVLYSSREDLETDFAEGLLVGTFEDGTEQLSDYLPASYLSAQRSLAHLLDLYANASGQNYNIRFDFSDDPDDYSVRLFQDDITGPWRVGVEVSLSYNVTPGMPVLSSSGEDIATWRLNRTITTYASIRDVRDPYLYVRSGGAIEAPIREYFVARWPLHAFITYVENGYYIETNASMSMLGRYYDSLEYASCCGIMTTINEERYDAYNSTPGGVFTNITFLDCGYFPESPITPSCRQRGDQLIYAVVNLTNYTLDPNDRITDPASSFPFTISAGLGLELFGLSIDDALVDVYEPIR